LDPLNPQSIASFRRYFPLKVTGLKLRPLRRSKTPSLALQQRKWQEAAELSGRVPRFSPDEYSPGYYLNAMANLYLGNLDAAEESARAAMRSDRERRNPRPNYVLGLILAKKSGVSWPLKRRTPI
jgi:hypothetical protein